MINQRIMNVKGIIQKNLKYSTSLNQYWKIFQQNHPRSILPTLYRLEQQFSKKQEELMKKKDILVSTEAGDIRETNEQVEEQIEDIQKKLEAINLLKTNDWSLSRKFQEMYQEYTSYYHLEKEDMGIPSVESVPSMASQQIEKLRERVEYQKKKDKKLQNRENRPKKQQEDSEQYVAKTKIIKKNKKNHQTRSQKRSSESMNSSQ